MACAKGRTIGPATSTICDSIWVIPQDLREAAMKTIDEMLNLALLTPDQHRQISSCWRCLPEAS